MTTAIRPATAVDRGAILALLVAQLRDHGIATPEDEIARTVDLVLRRPHRGCFVLAVDAGRVVGLAAVSFGFPVEHGGRGAWLEELYVEPAARGHGLGERLLAAALDAARAGGAVAIDLEIEAGHERVESLYRRAGFAPLARSRWALRLAVASVAAPTRPEHVTGGCLCGAVRYAASGQPREVSHCHCSMCRRAAGAPLVTWATFPVDAFRWTAGPAASWRSSPPATRSFCGTCGTALTFVTIDEPTWIDVTVASMDQAAEMWPHDHIWTGDRLPWLVLDDDLPRLPRGHGG
jgi:GNAT superfamily N-acetyltransferase